MTPALRKLLIDLLGGQHYLKIWSSTNNSRSFKLYAGNMNPCRYVGYRTMKRIKDILKKDKHGRYTLNLSRVRQLHGNNMVKKLYKQYSIIRKSNSHGSNNRLCKDV